jgi:RimJ/RimL family protein N-acetyltransferase
VRVTVKEPPGSTLQTSRLEMRPITLDIVEAVFNNDRGQVEALAGAYVPSEWPGRALVERAFSASLERIRADPATRLWGDRLMITRGDEPRLVGSVVFHGRPGPDGLCEIGYGVEEQSQRQGYATEAVSASVEWALAQPGVEVVQAATFAWHLPSIRVLEKVGFVGCGTRDHETLGELLVYERRR